MAVQDQHLIILWIERLGATFTEDVYALGRTPRGYAPLPKSHSAVVSSNSSDDVLCAVSCVSLIRIDISFCYRVSCDDHQIIEGDPKGGPAWPVLEGEEDEDEGDKMQVDGENKKIQAGVPGSAIRVVEPTTGRTRQRIELEEGRVAISVEVSQGGLSLRR